MTLKKCSNKVNPFINMLLFTFKKNLGFTAIASILAFIFSPLLFWNLANQMHKLEDDFLYNLMDDFVSFSTFMASTCMAFAVLLLILNFKYLTDRSGTDAFHALPLTRAQLFFARFIPCYVLSLVPLSISYLGYMLLTLLPGIFGKPSFMLPAFLFTALMMLFLCAFVSIFILSAGCVFDCIVSIGAINIGVPIVIILIGTLCQNVLFGFNYSTYYTNAFVYGTPFGFAYYNLYKYSNSYSFGESVNIFPIVQTIVIILIIALLIALNIFLYNRRKSEKAGTSFAFPFMPIIISFIIAFIGFYVFGYIFGNVGSVLYYIMGSVGAVLAVLIYSVITNRGFKKWKNTLILAGFSILICFLINGAITLDIFGYENHIPKLEDIKSANVTVIDDATAKGKSIKYVTALHEEIIKNKDFEKTSHHPWQDLIAIDYTLKNGKTVSRDYYVPNDIATQQKADIIKNVYLPSILEDFEQSKELNFVLESYNPNENENYVVQLKREEAKQLLDIYSSSLEDMGIELTEKFFTKEVDSVLLYASSKEGRKHWFNLYFCDDFKEFIELKDKFILENEQIKTE